MDTADFMLEISMAINREFIEEVGASRWLWRTVARQLSKRVFRRDNAIVLPTGLRMTLPANSKFASEVFVTHANVDWGSEAVFAGNLDRAGVFLDIGANIGYYSMYLLPVVSEVHAFEPDVRALTTLRSNFAGHPEAHVHAVALANRTGKARFRVASDCEVSHLIDQSAADDDSPEIDVTTIDQFVSDNRLSITGIKIDVEGADLKVIEGGLSTLAMQYPLVLTETEPAQRLFGLIAPLGYRVFAFVKEPTYHRFSLHEIQTADRPRTKMLFLVPPRLHSAFKNLAFQQAQSVR